MSQDDTKKIKDILEEFFQKMTIPVTVDVNISGPTVQNEPTGDGDTVEVRIKTEDPQILIGEKGQTLTETQRILKNIIFKKTGKVFRFHLDINDYRKKKTEYLKGLAKDLADEVSLTKEPKILPPMSPYERRIIHMELATREDIITESEGEGADRKVVIKAKLK